MNPSYVLISACRNESDYIDGLIDSITAQTVQPMCLLIVDDGSTDDTYTRACAKSAAFSFIRVIQMPKGNARSFSSQVFAAMHGYSEVKDLSFAYLGFLDTDIRVEPDYYERLIQFMEADASLGLCGGAVVDQYPDRLVESRKGSEDYHVAGGVQFFRRLCFEQIGGHHPIEGGGQDTIADIMALMHGWKIRVFTELRALHLRPDGFVKVNVFESGIKWGRKFYLIGYHPLYYFGQCIRRINRSPILIGSICQMLGFLWAAIRGGERPVSPEFVCFLRRLQLRRLWRMIVSKG